MKPKSSTHDPLRFWVKSLCLVSAFFICGLTHAQDPGGNLPFDLPEFTGAEGALDFPENLPSLQGSAMAYDADATTPQLIVFGGQYRQGSVYSDQTWIFDGYEWVEIFPATIPPARAYHEMVYDATNDVVVMFGGHDGTNLNDTWIWDGNNWTLQSPTSSPSARYHFGMTFDAARGKAVLYGGSSNDSGRDNDTWTWDSSTGEWTEITPTTQPEGKRYHALGYDTGNSKIVMYGGDSTGATSTWTWDGADWFLENPASNPGVRQHHKLVGEPVRGGVVVFKGWNGTYSNSTWRWDGSEWSELALDNTPENRYYHTAAYDPDLGGLVISNGVIPSGAQRADTWLLPSNSDVWVNLTGDVYQIDMRDHPDGVYQYTSIDIPSDITVKFLKNDANTPVYWFATENVVINGNINLDGEDGQTSNEPGDEAKGGPGGFAGGLGGTRFDVAGSYSGAPGQGPGGGLPGVDASQHGSNASFNGTYGNASLIPMVGGSGGGGGASSTTAHGGTGGGGGGAILIASNRNITVNGSITADGGTYRQIASRGGYGSGGAIRLVADRVSGTGTLYARNGANATTGDGTGYVRLEAFYRTIVDDGTIGPVATAGAPPSDPGAFFPTDQPTLVIAEVAGLPVPEPPSGSSVNPDVVFQETGAINVKVIGLNIPDGTPVSLRIVTSGEVINLPGPGNPIVRLTGGEATFSVFVPAGLGNIQAFSEFTP